MIEGARSARRRLALAIAFTGAAITAHAQTTLPTHDYEASAKRAERTAIAAAGAAQRAAERTWESRPNSGLTPPKHGLFLP